MSYAIAFGVSLVYIFLKATQQIAVINFNYRLVVPVAFGIAMCEVSVIALVVKNSFIMCIPIGLGGAIGAVIAMKVRDRRRIAK